MISKSLFGNRLKEQRKFLGLSQAQAAENAGIERETWGKYERGVFMPGGDVLISFLSMGINVSALFSIEPEFPTLKVSATAYSTSSTQKAKNQLQEPKASYGIEKHLTEADEELLAIFHKLKLEDRHTLKRQAQMLLEISEREKKPEDSEVHKAG
ncbi:helix-turn-helix domain-containing protein [Bergeriella denitrificans]|uniref:helix-turn-helix domain-containing protein n=2 Tax=Bergeriella denitrificans TaxID=494 RepID=UPI001FE98DD4|nr:helix-turn-helix transcriptional regulator [Bergeriella denitrificans]